MCNRLVDFLEKKKVFFDNQFGFRAKHSTDHAILSIVDKIQRAIDERDFSCGIFLDFSKAFDTINHEILFTKVEFDGIRGIANQWFSSYLSNRMQTVTVNGVTSNSVNISCGVPQGSVLGPILFLLYINDFHHCSKVLISIYLLMTLIYSANIKISLFYRQVLTMNSLMLIPGSVQINFLSI